jgi:hypothetical protein
MAFGFSEPAGSPLHSGYVAPDSVDLDELYDDDDWVTEIDDDELDDETWDDDDDEDEDEERREWDASIAYLMEAMK